MNILEYCNYCIIKSPSSINYNQIDEYIGIHHLSRDSIVIYNNNIYLDK